MITLTLEIDGEEKTYQFERKEEKDGWEYREDNTTIWSHWTDKKHSRDLIILQAEMYFEENRDIR